MLGQILLLMWKFMTKPCILTMGKHIRHKNLNGIPDVSVQSRTFITSIDTCKTYTMAAVFSLVFWSRGVQGGGGVQSTSLKFSLYPSRVSLLHNCIAVGVIPVCSDITVLNWWYKFVVCHTGNRIPIIPWQNYLASVTFEAVTCKQDLN